MHIPFFFSFCETGNIAPQGKSRSENKSGYDPLCVYYFFLSLFHEFSFAEHVCRLSVRIAEFGRCHPLHC